MDDDCSAKSLVDDITLDKKELLLFMMDFDRSSDWGCWNAVVPPPKRRKRSVRT